MNRSHLKLVAPEPECCIVDPDETLALLNAFSLAETSATAMAEIFKGKPEHTELMRSMSFFNLKLNELILAHLSTVETYRDMICGADERNRLMASNSVSVLG